MSSIKYQVIHWIKTANNKLKIYNTVQSTLMILCLEIKHCTGCEETLKLFHDCVKMMISKDKIILQINT